VSSFAEEDLSRDAFLGGKLYILQPRNGYRAGVDPVLLAATVEAQAGQSVLELGCGAGAASLCLGARIPGLSLTGVEKEPAYAELAACNGRGSLEVVTADISDMPLSLRQRQFDHVLANPPFFDRAAGIASDNPAKEAAFGEDTPLRDWVRVAAKRLAPKGLAHFVHRAERLPDLLRAMPHDLGSIEVLPLAPRTSRDVERVIIRARKGGRGAFRLATTLVMHEGAQHDQDGDSFVPAIRAVLRHGEALKF